MVYVLFFIPVIAIPILIFLIIRPVFDGKGIMCNCRGSMWPNDFACRRHGRTGHPDRGCRTCGARGALHDEYTPHACGKFS